MLTLQSWVCARDKHRQTVYRSQCRKCILWSGGLCRKGNYNKSSGMYETRIREKYFKMSMERTNDLTDRRPQKA
ncbi:unnamed protein product [Debaryomyces tyrocola]|nr:unnamed protein product [Debaryomyces tyrocola]